MPRYIFQDGGSASDTDFFNAYVDQLLAGEQQAIEEEPVEYEEEPDEESEYIKSLREYDNEQGEAGKLQDLNDKILALETALDERMSSFSQRREEIDWYEDEDGQEMLMKMYNTNNPSVSYTPNSKSILQGIFKPEGARLGQQTNIVDPTTGRRGSALGRGQMIKGTRTAMYKKLGITDIAAAEQKFMTDPNFETMVMEAYVGELDSRIPSNVQGLQRQRMIAKGWYTGNPFVADNYYPGRGNKLSAGQYADRATK